MKSIYKNDFFDTETFDKIKKVVLEKINEKEHVHYSKEFKRYYRILRFNDDIHNLLLDISKKQTGDDSLEIIYSQIVKYQIVDGAVPALTIHKDTDSLGEWIMDIAIDCTIDWPLVIEDESFSNMPNSVFFIRGKEDFHGRNTFPSQNEDDYVLLLFVHLANKDSKYAQISKEVFSMDDEKLNNFLRVATPSWGYNLYA